MVRLLPVSHRRAWHSRHSSANGTRVGRMEEIADRVWVARHDYLNVNVGIVGGSRGLLVIDTLWSEESARSLAARLPDEVVAVVNTHDHWDHVLGNAVFGAPIHAH